MNGTARIHLAIVLAGLLTVSSSMSEGQADLLLYEGFDYPTTASTTSIPESVGDRSLSGVVLAGGPNISFANMGGYQNADTGTLWSPININPNVDGNPGGGMVYNTAGDVDVVAGSLSYLGLAASTGNSVSYGGSGYSPRLIFSPITAAGGFPAAAVPGPDQGVNNHNGAANITAANSFNGSVFYSAIVQVNSANEPFNHPTLGLLDWGDPIIHFHALTTQGVSQTSAHAAGTYVKVDPTDPSKFLLGISKGESVSGAEATYGTTSYAWGTTLFLVAEWEFVANSNPEARENNDVVRLYVNPTVLGGDGGSSSPAALITDLGPDLPLGSVAITSIVLAQRTQGAPNVIVDELRVGTTFASVTPQGAVVADADFNGDGAVDGADFLIWQRGLGGAPTLANGNANGDGAVNGLDLDVWKNQFGLGAAAGAVAAVPEPASVLLAIVAAVGLAAHRRR